MPPGGLIADVETSLDAVGSSAPVAGTATMIAATAVHVERKRTRRAALLVNALFLMCSSPAMEGRTDPVRCPY